MLVTRSELDPITHGSSVFLAANHMAHAPCAGSVLTGYYPTTGQGLTDGIQGLGLTSWRRLGA